MPFGADLRARWLPRRDSAMQRPDAGDETVDFRGYRRAMAWWDLLASARLALVVSSAFRSRREPGPPRIAPGAVGS